MVWKKKEDECFAILVSGMIKYSFNAEATILHVKLKQIPLEKMKLKKGKLMIALEVTLGKLENVVKALRPILCNCVLIWNTWIC